MKILRSNCHRMQTGIVNKGSFQSVQMNSVAWASPRSELWAHTISFAARRGRFRCSTKGIKRLCQMLLAQIMPGGC